MNTNDPALSKTRIDDKDHTDNTNDEFTVNTIVDYDYTESSQTQVAESGVQANRVSGSGVSDPSQAKTSSLATHKENDNFHDSHDEIEDHTTVNKGTDTFEDDIVDSEHVKDGDNPARQPDRRDQQGSTAFDGNVNEETVGNSGPQSDEITDRNRYANIDNAQTRTLTPDEKD